MRLELRKRKHSLRKLRGLSPWLALALTMGLCQALVGWDSTLWLSLGQALGEPQLRADFLGQNLVLLLMAMGLCVAFRCGSHNLGIAGQLSMALVVGSGIAGTGLLNSGLGLALALVLCVVVGAAYALIPALLKLRFSTDEVISSVLLMLVADALRRAMQGDAPRAASHQALLSHGGAQIAVIVFCLTLALAAAYALFRGPWALRIGLSGAAPRAARFIGIDDRRVFVFGFVCSGAMAGIAGWLTLDRTLAVAEPLLAPDVGFSALVIAYLARFNPLMALLAAFFMALISFGAAGVAGPEQGPYVAMAMHGLVLVFALVFDAFASYQWVLQRGVHR